MTTYKPSGYDPDYSTALFYTESHEVPSNSIWVLSKMYNKNEFQSWNINKDYALKAVCQAYIGDEREGLSMSKAMIAYLAGYTVADKDGDVFDLKRKFGDPGTTDILRRRFSPYKIISTNEEPEIKRVDKLPKPDENCLDYMWAKINELVDVVNSLAAGKEEVA